MRSDSCIETWAKEMGVDEPNSKHTQIYDLRNGLTRFPPIWAYSRYVPVGNGAWKDQRRKLKINAGGCGKAQWLPGMGKWSRVC